MRGVRWLLALLLCGTGIVTALTPAHAQEEPFLVSLTPSATTVQAGSTFELVARVRDPQLIVAVVNGAYRTPNGQSLSFSATRRVGNGTDSIWHMEVSVPREFNSGEYFVYIFSILYFPNGVRATKDIRYPTPPLPGATFTVVGGSSDTVAPSILSLMSSQQTVCANASLTVTVRLTDDDVGASNVTVEYVDASSSRFTGFFQRVSGTPQDGIWRATVRPNDSERSRRGSVAISSITLVDRAGNNTTIHAPAFPTENGYFTVVDCAAPTFAAISPDRAPTIGGTMITITGSGFQPGVEVTLGGLPLRDFVVVDASTITGIAPALPAGSVPLRIANPDYQSVYQPNVFTYYYLSVVPTPRTSGAPQGGMAPPVPRSTQPPAAMPAPLPPRR